MKDALKWLANRLKERSTWLGITSLATAIGIGIDPDQIQAIVGVGVAIGGLIAVFMKDAGSPDKPVEVKKD